MKWKMDCLPGNQRLLSLAAILLTGFMLGAPAYATSVFINEIHYDNVGTDVGEGVEIAGPAGVSLDGWRLDLYNGSNGTVYSSISLEGNLPLQQNGFGTLAFSTPGIQNGAPDGIALVNGIDVVQFLSYEGIFSAVAGPAAGRTSTDIGFSENTDNLLGYSLQLKGTGFDYDDFIWGAAMEATFGGVNGGQFFLSKNPSSDHAPLPTPEPGTFLLLGSGMAGFFVLRRRGGDFRRSAGSASPG